MPTDSTTSDIVGTGLFAFGADYRLAYKPPTFGSFASGASVSVDYFDRDDYGNIPVLLNYLAIKDSWTFSVGAGVGFTSIPGSERGELRLRARRGVRLHHHQLLSDLRRGQVPRLRRRAR